MTLREDGGRVRVDARQFPTNQGGLCQKGWTAADLLDHAERLTTPLVRDGKDEPLRPATWEEALDRVVGGIVRIQSAHGRDAVAVFGGGGLTNEKAYALGKFARVALRTKHIDYNGRFCMSSAAAAGIRPSAWTAACRSRSTTSGGPTRCCSWARTWPRRCRPSPAI